MHRGSRQPVCILLIPFYHHSDTHDDKRTLFRAPKAHVAVYERFMAGDLKAAKAVQDVLADADLSQQKLGVSGLKFAVSHYFGYGSGRARSPLPAGDDMRLQAEEVPLKALVDLENSL